MFVEVVVNKISEYRYMMAHLHDSTRLSIVSDMNAESSRSHLIISIVLETTNKSTGQILKGKVRKPRQRISVSDSEEIFLNRWCIFVFKHFHNVKPYIYGSGCGQKIGEFDIICIEG